MRAIINDNGTLIEGDFKSLDGLTVEWQESDGAIPQALLDAIAAQETAPDWDGFNAYILADTAFQATTAQVREVAPSLTETLAAAYLLVGQGNIATFAFLMGQIYAIATVTQSQRNTWADTARDTYNLPADFVAVVRGAS